MTKELNLQSRISIGDLLFSTTKNLHLLVCYLSFEDSARICMINLESGLLFGRPKNIIITTNSPDPELGDLFFGDIDHYKLVRLGNVIHENKR